MSTEFTGLVIFILDCLQFKKPIIKNNLYKTNYQQLNNLQIE